MLSKIVFAIAVALGLYVPHVAEANDSSGDTNAFARFVGTWKLKDDRFQQVWDGKTVQTLSIPGHTTRCAPVNTDKSVLCAVDAVDFKGHILWAYDESARSVSHLSQFGQSRIGTGTGLFDATGGLTLRIKFSDEPAGTYRVYRYVWVSSDEYHMMSRQYGATGEPTGNWYGGSFVRVTSSN